MSDIWCIDVPEIPEDIQKAWEEIERMREELYGSYLVSPYMLGKDE